MRDAPRIPRFARDKLQNQQNLLLFTLVDWRRLGDVDDGFEGGALGAGEWGGTGGEVVLAVLFEAFEEVMEVVGQAHHRPAQLVLDALERLEVVAAEGREERLDLGDPLPHLVEILVLDVEEELLLVDQQRLGARHLVVDPVPELDDVDAAPLREEARLEEVLPEVAEKLAVVGAVELFVREVADVPDAVAHDVVARGAELTDHFLELLDGKRLQIQRFGEGCGHPAREDNTFYRARRTQPSPERLSTTDAKQKHPGSTWMRATRLSVIGICALVTDISPT